MNGNDALNREGFYWARNALPENVLEPLLASTARNVNLSSDLIVVCHELLAQNLPCAFPTKAALFDKNPDRNWSLAWHQDRVIAVAEKHETPGFTNWTRKDGIWHAEPPLGILENMVFIQIYLDDVGEDDGPTELAIGTHRFGKSYQDQIETRTKQTDKYLCLANRGDILICRALILHRSRPSFSQRSRRIIRVDFANRALPEPLAWNRA